jgi:hypothetical protein
MLDILLNAALFCALVAVGIVAQQFSRWVRMRRVRPQR